MMDFLTENSNTLVKIMDYKMVIYRRVKFTRRLDNRRVIQCRGRYHDGSMTVVVSQYYTTVHTVVESRNQRFSFKTVV